MFTSTQEVADFISEQNIELVDVRFCDVPGVQQHFTIPVSEFLDAALSDGLMFDGSSVRGFTAIHESDMKLIPDISSAFVDPFRDRKTLVVNFSIVDPFTDEPFSPRPAPGRCQGRGIPALDRHRGRVLHRCRGRVLPLR